MNALLRIYACVFIMGDAAATPPGTLGQFFCLACIALIAGLICGNAVASYIWGDGS